MKRSLLVLLCVLVAGCTTTETVVDRVEVPVPYWEKPDGIKELPERTPLRYKTIPPEASKEDTEAAFEAVAEDMGSLLAENELLRHLYLELVKLIETEPEEGGENGEHPE